MGEIYAEFQTCGGVNICHPRTNIHQSAWLHIIYYGGSRFFPYFRSCILAYLIIPSVNVVRGVLIMFFYTSSVLVPGGLIYTRNM